MTEVATIHGFAKHPLRDFVLAEMAARPFTPMEAPCRLIHFAFMPEGEARASDRGALRALCESRGLPGPPSGAKYHRVDFGAFVLRWEGHSEFTTYTFELAGAAPDGPFQPPASSFLDLMRLVPAPGPLLVMADLHLMDAGREAATLDLFGAQELAFAEVKDGAASIVTDFREAEDGFVRLAILNRSLSAGQSGALAQRVLEIETYRTLTLLGLPQAQALGPSIRKIELQLPQMMEAMRASSSVETNRALLDSLMAQAAELETAASAGTFRFGATRAYGELIRLRLEAAGERPVAGRASWTAFLGRRLQPAIRTCAAMQAREEDLSRRLGRAAQLLRTRVDLDLETQNGEVLRAMNDRARLQLRLQQTVEGLSVAAISYYIASLAHHVFEGMHAAGVPVDPAVATALAVPFVLAFVGYVVWRIRRKHEGE